MTEQKPIAEQSVIGFFYWHVIKNIGKEKVISDHKKSALFRKRIFSYTSILYSL
ncbi:hypothetical protein L293_0366 [Acinetobacter gyllenbergii CIP 110306 = MTCC 11365]|nr:hypothetical protein L293_0366 [Acinetobacter gyllenbergii CIP 110306 = MTCC 11365]